MITVGVLFDEAGKGISSASDKKALVPVLVQPSTQTFRVGVSQTESPREEGKIRNW